MIDTWKTLATLALSASLLAPAIGCAHVSRDELNTEMAGLRADLQSEMQESDAELAREIDGLDARVGSLSRTVAEVEARTMRLETDLQALAAEFDATVVRLEDALAFNAPVHFEYDSAEIRARDEPVLQRFAAVVQDVYPESLITIEGFTDPAGSPAYNQALGEARAEAVKGFLSEQGLAAERIRTVSYGEDEARLVVPGAEGPGEAGLPNRRVTLVIETGGADWDIVAAGETVGES